MEPREWLRRLAMCVLPILWAAAANGQESDPAMDAFVDVFDATVEVLDAIEAAGDVRTFQWEEQRRLLLPLVDELVEAWEVLAASGISDEDATSILAQVLAARQVQAVALLELEQCEAAAAALDALNAHPALSTGEYGYVRAAVERRRLEAGQCIQLQQGVSALESALDSGCTPGLTMPNPSRDFDVSEYPLLEVRMRAAETRLTACVEQMEWVRDPGRRRLGWVLSGVGVALLISGAGTGMLANGSEDDASSIASGAGTLDEYRNAQSQGQSRASAATALFVAGGVLTGTGVSLALTAPRRQRLSDASSASSAPQRAVLTVAPGRFSTLGVSW